ncbi:MAG TPA: phosphoribosylglycinamide formyltransferase [Flavipsychrobacter sp.]|nr:phosphoribosylglycinamide formyltransferase [Flavipsychrobacter sp.]
MHNLVVFASGRGSNAAAIIEYFKQNGLAKIALIVSNKADAGVINIAENEHIPFLIVDKQSFHETLLLDQLQSYKPSFIVLAGFLWKIPDHIIQTFPDRIINIHPALLPNYGGKGMYGHYVHRAVLGAKDAESGITIHYVNEVYDSANIILQARCKVHEDDTADTLAGRIHSLEHFYYPRAIEFLLSNKDAQTE